MGEIPRRRKTKGAVGGCCGFTYLERGLVRERISTDALSLQGVHEGDVGVQNDHPRNRSQHRNNRDEVLEGKKKDRQLGKQKRRERRVEEQTLKTVRADAAHCSSGFGRR